MIKHPDYAICRMLLQESADPTDCNRQVSQVMQKCLPILLCGLCTCAKILTPKVDAETIYWRCLFRTCYGQMRQPVCMLLSRPRTSSACFCHTRILQRHTEPVHTNVGMGSTLPLQVSCTALFPDTVLQPSRAWTTSWRCFYKMESILTYRKRLATLPCWKPCSFFHYRHSCLSSASFWLTEPV